MFRVDTAAGSKALRLHRPASRSKSHIRSELAFLEHLIPCGLAVPSPLAALEGDALLELVKTGVPNWYCDVTTWLEVRHQLEYVATYQLGLTLARVHLRISSLLNLEVSLAASWK